MQQRPDEMRDDAKVLAASEKRGRLFVDRFPIRRLAGDDGFADLLLRLALSGALERGERGVVLEVRAGRLFAGDGLEEVLRIDQRHGSSLERPVPCKPRSSPGASAQRPAPVGSRVALRLLFCL